MGSCPWGTPTTPAAPATAPRGRSAGTSNERLTRRKGDSSKRGQLGSQEEKPQDLHRPEFWVAFASSRDSWCAGRDGGDVTAGEDDVVDDAMTLPVEERRELAPGVFPPGVGQPSVVGGAVGPERGDQQRSILIRRHLNRDAQAPLLEECIAGNIDAAEDFN